MSLRGANVLVTGGAGFIGSHFVDRLLREDVARVVVLDLLTYAGDREHLHRAESDPRVVFVHGDVCDALLVADLLGGHRIDHVVHLAAETHVDRSIDDAAAFVRSNVEGTRVLLEAFRRHLGRSSPKAGARFLHASTDEVFGALGEDDPPFDEASPYAPSSPYSASKAAADHLVRAYGRTHGLPFVITHVTNTYGPRQFPEKLIPLMIRKALRHEDLPLYGSGRQIRDWVHVGDHCEALLLAMNEGPDGASYTLGAGCERRNREVVHAVAEELLRRVPERVPERLKERIREVEDRPGHDFRYAVDPARARQVLGWEPRIAFEDGLASTVAWYLEHEAWCLSIEERGYHGERLGRA